jgi:ribbon-helix-helix CopG family protein
MVRTTVYLTQDAKARLVVAAERHRCSEAELIRQAVDLLLASEPNDLPARPPPAGKERGARGPESARAEEI